MPSQASIFIKKPSPKQGPNSKLFQLFDVAVVLVITMLSAAGLAVVFIGSSLPKGLLGARRGIQSLGSCLVWAAA